MTDEQPKSLFETKRQEAEAREASRAELTARIRELEQKLARLEARLDRLEMALLPN